MSETNKFQRLVEELCPVGDNAFKFLKNDGQGENNEKRDPEEVVAPWDVDSSWDSDLST